VRELVESGNIGFVVPLFLDGWVSWSAEYLHLGLDLAECAGWENHEQLVDRLRSVEEHDSARFELGLWAGGVRSGLGVHYFDPAQTPQCDLRYSDGATAYDIEAKAVDDAPSDRNSSLLDDAVSHCLLEFDHHVQGGFKLIVFPDSALVRAAREEPPADFDRRLAEPINALRKWLNVALTPLAIGVHAKVEGLGEVRLIADDSDVLQSEVVGMPRTDFYQEVCRALRPVRRKANLQLASSNATRIAAVWTGSSSCPAHRASDIARILVAKQEPYLANIDWIAFVNSHTAFGDWRTSVVAIPVRRLATEFPTRIKTALTNWQRSS
jgi:hypothetical protein